MSSRWDEPFGLFYPKMQIGQTDPDPLLKVLTEIGHRLLQVERERDEYQAALERSEHTYQRQAIELSQTEENLTRQAAEAQRFRTMNQEWRDFAHAAIGGSPRSKAAEMLRERLRGT